MAQTGRDIQRRMNSIRNTQQITKAMEIIAGVKLRKARGRVEATRPYQHRLRDTLQRVLEAAAVEGDTLPPIAREAEGSGHCLIVVTADKGLAGGYNSNVLRRAEVFRRENESTQLVLIGRKAREFYRRRDVRFLADWVNVGDDIRFSEAREISAVVQEFFLGGLFARISLLYTEFQSAVSHRPVVKQLLPLADGSAERGSSASSQGPKPLYWYEPSLAGVLRQMVPLYLDSAIYHGLLEGAASEQGARVTAMRNASDNAGELIEELNLSYNRIRQGIITKELSEIVGGAEALES